jgi:hypothetical protein
MIPSSRTQLESRLPSNLPRRTPRLSQSSRRKLTELGNLLNRPRKRKRKPERSSKTSEMR